MSKDKDIDTTTTVSTGFTFDIPAEPQDVPQPKGGVRRVELEDGKWLDVRAAGNQADGRFLGWWFGEMQVAGRLTDLKERQQRTLELNAYVAKFIGDRVMDHNLCYPGSDEPLPKGYLLFWEMQESEVYALINVIQSAKPQIVRLQDPKPDAASTNG